MGNGYFITNDYALLHQEESVLDPVDKQILKDAGADKCISVEEALEQLIEKEKNVSFLGETEKEPLSEKHAPLTPEKVKELSKVARSTIDYLDTLFSKEMDKPKADFIRELRVGFHYSWRALARQCHKRWGTSWDPPSNQLVGMKLCEYAAKHFNEDSNKEPWN